MSQEATESDFREYFTQFGRVLDATLMMDKDTGRPRGFGFVTFDSEGAVENALNYPKLEILGKAVSSLRELFRAKDADYFIRLKSRRHSTAATRRNTKTAVAASATATTAVDLIVTDKVGLARAVTAHRPTEAVVAKPDLGSITA